MGNVPEIRGQGTSHHRCSPRNAVRGCEQRSGTIMAKQCKVCTQFYPDHLPVCPHCANARAAAAESDSGEEPIDVFPEEELTLDSPELAPMDESLPLPGSKPPPGKQIPGFHGISAEEGGSSVNLGALPQTPAV